KAPKSAAHRARATRLPGGAPLEPAHDFGTISVLPIFARDLPSTDKTDSMIVDQAPRPDAGGAPAQAPVPAAPPDGCEQPVSMHKLTSGTFLGGLTMDSYFPTLAGGALYSHPGTAGPFDTGSRAGANVQLYGVIRSPCSPGGFTLDQWVTRDRFRVNGVVQTSEGEHFDDIARS